MEVASCQRFLQKPGWNSCMPVQLKINECIVIIVNIVAIVQVALHDS